MQVQMFTTIPFSCMLYSLVDPQEEHQEEEEFKPFVFKDHPAENGHES